jgi:hypothetical protein
VAVARAALREGIDSLPSAQLAGVELDIRLLGSITAEADSQPRRPQHRPALASA